MNITKVENSANFDNFTLYIKGTLSFENNNKIRKEIQDLQTLYPECKIEVNMKNVEFVGSSAISHFVEIFNLFNEIVPCIELSEVRPEFLKVFKLYNLNFLDKILEDFNSDDRVQSFGTRLRKHFVDN